jgi:soluble lytic murein transglycosylase-like protein
MTACERATAGPEAAVMVEEVEVSQTAVTSSFRPQAWRAAMSQFVQDVLLGLRRVSHSALAMLGLVAVVGVVFLAGRPDVRYRLEHQTLGWLTDRATSRAMASDDAEASSQDVLLALAEPEAIQRATATDPSELSRQQAAVAYWIARRYSVAPEPISRLVQEAWDVGQRAGVEPTLVLAIMAIESGFNPFAQSHVGAQGLMQVMTGIHRDKYEVFGGRNAAFDPVTNLRVGVQVLKDCIRRAGSVAGGLKHYVGAANMTHDGGYGAKVLTEQGFLRQVAMGKQVPVNVSNAPRVVAQAPVPVVPAAASAVHSSATPAEIVPVSATPAASSAKPPVVSPAVEQVAALTL